ncbi:MAG: hypothetical protein WDM81_16660 [Rhizomicrobium sp.]
MGSGNVRIKAYRGNLSNDGMANVQVGDRAMAPSAIPPVPPMPPVPRVPVIPPVPPVPPHHHDNDDD